MWILRGKAHQHIEALRKTSKNRWLFSLFSYSDAPHKKTKLAPLQERRMIDKFKIYAKGGDGGNGCSSFRRSRHDRRGRPDGGSGGKGGDVILECSSANWDFSGLQHHLIAKRGGPGASKNMIGTRGADKVVHIPVGTVIHLVKGDVPSIIKNQSSTGVDPWEIHGTLVDNVSGSDEGSTYNAPNVNNEMPSVCNTGCSSSHSESNTKLSASSNQDIVVQSNNGPEDAQEILYNVVELTKEGERVIVARGGEGGLGNVSLASISKQLETAKPVIHKDDASDLENSMNGMPGSEAVLVLELKSIADVSFVGMPNAGKSTLLGAISRAKPAVGHYAFTTLRPNLGNLNYDDLSITVADIPGLIKGAHENRGLGHAFLRHIERTKVLAYVVDLAASLDDRKGIPPWEQLKDLILELEYHQEGLSDKPSLVVANKIDEEGAEAMYEELKRRVQGVPMFPVCAVLEEGVPELKEGLRMLVNGDISNRLRLEQILLH